MISYFAASKRPKWFVFLSQVIATALAVIFCFTLLPFFLVIAIGLAIALFVMLRIYELIDMRNEDANPTDSAESIK